MKFKDGDRVRINKCSKFAHQSVRIGTLKLRPEISVGYDCEYFIGQVKFDDGFENSYRGIDLVLVSRSEEVMVEDLLTELTAMTVGLSVL